MSEFVAPPGWYVDTDNPSMLRFFDGNEWTENRMLPAPSVSEQPAAQLPPPPGYDVDPGVGVDVGVVDRLEALDPVAEPVEVVEPAVVAEPVEVVEPAVVAEPVEVVEPAVVAEPVEVVEPAVVTEPVGVVEPAVVTEPVEVVEPAVVTEPVEVAVDDSPMRRPVDVSEELGLYNLTTPAEPAEIVAPVVMAEPVEVAVPEIAAGPEVHGPTETNTTTSLPEDAAPNFQLDDNEPDQPLDVIPPAGFTVSEPVVEEIPIPVAPSFSDDAGVAEEDLVPNDLPVVEPVVISEPVAEPVAVKEVAEVTEPVMVAEPPVIDVPTVQAPEVVLPEAPVVEDTLASVEAPMIIPSEPDQAAPEPPVMPVVSEPVASEIVTPPVLTETDFVIAPLDATPAPMPSVTPEPPVIPTAPEPQPQVQSPPVDAPEPVLPVAEPVINAPEPQVQLPPVDAPQPPVMPTAPNLQDELNALSTNIPQPEPPQFEPEPTFTQPHIPSDQGHFQHPGTPTPLNLEDMDPGPESSIFAHERRRIDNGTPHPPEVTATPAIDFAIVDRANPNAPQPIDDNGFWDNTVEYDDNPPAPVDDAAPPSWDDYVASIKETGGKPPALGSRDAPENTTFSIKGLIRNSLSNLIPTLKTAAIPLVVLAVVFGALFFAAFTYSAGQIENSTNLADALTSLLFLFVIFGVLTGVGSVILMNALIISSDDASLGRPPSPLGVLKRAVFKAPGVFIAQLIFVMAPPLVVFLIFGLLAMFVPVNIIGVIAGLAVSIYAAVRFSLMAPIIATGEGFVASVKEGIGIVQGKWFAVLGRILLLTLLLIVVSIPVVIFSLILAAVVPFPIISTLFGLIVYVVLAAFAANYVVGMMYGLRAEKQGEMV